MAIKHLPNGGLVLTGEHIEYASHAAAFAAAKLDLEHGIKMRITRAAWANLAQLCGVPAPRGKRQKAAIYDALKHNFPVMAGAEKGGK